MPAIPSTHRAIKLAIHMGEGPDLVATMLERQNLAGASLSCRKLSSGSIGSVGGHELPRQGDVSFFTGVPINGPASYQGHDFADTVSRLCEYDGAYAAVFWDEAAGKLAVVSDFLGLQPLYMQRREGELRIASETKAFDAEPDAAGWGAFISMGHTIGSQTLLDGVQRLPPAALLIYDVATDRLDIKQHWHWPKGNAELSTRSVGEALQRSIEAYDEYGADASLLLSGGFDSRLLLYALRQAGHEPEALIVAHDDELQDADGTLARMLARREDVRYRFGKPPTDFFSSRAFLDYVIASDAAIPTMDLFIAKVVDQIDAEAVWDGLVPGFALRLLFAPGTTLHSYAAAQCEGWDSRQWKAARVLFGEDYAWYCYQSFRTALEEELAQLPGDDVGASAFIIRNRIRHRTASNPIKVFGNTTLPFLPGMTREFMSLLSDLPRHTAQPYDFYFKLFRDCFPQALKLPILKGGEIVRTEGGHRHYWKYRALDRVNNFLGQRPRADVRRLWNSGQPSISTFLTSDETLLQSDGWIRPEAVSAMTPRDPLYVPVRRLLFHWRAWAWVHEGRLEQMLKPAFGKR